MDEHGVWFSEGAKRSKVAVFNTPQPHSPAFEMALYTMVFLDGEEHNEVMMGPYHAEITAYRMKQKGKDLIGTCYPGLSNNLHPVQAAQKIQAVHRGRVARRGGIEQVHEKNAATRIQAQHRGQATRRQVGDRRN